MGRPKGSSNAGKSMPLYTVAIAFQDAKEYVTDGTPTQYEVGDDVSHFDQQRLDNAVAIGTVQFNGDAEPEEETEA